MKSFLITLTFLLTFQLVKSQNDRSAILKDLEKSQVSDQQSSVIATTKSATRLFAEKGDLTTVILIIPSGSEVNVLGSDSTYLHVTIEDNDGYIYKRDAVISISEAPEKVTSQANDSTMESRPAAADRTSRFSWLENKYGTTMAAKLMQGKIWRGMTGEMVIDSWGNPLKMNRVISGNTIREEWIYKNSWLFIQNDVLTDWGPVK